MRDHAFFHFCDLSKWDDCPQCMANMFLWFLPRPLQSFARGGNAKISEQLCDFFLQKFVFIFLKEERLSYNVCYLESSLWKCFERFCEWLHVISGIKEYHIQNDFTLQNLHYNTLQNLNRIRHLKDKQVHIHNPHIYMNRFRCSVIPWKSLSISR